MRLFALHDKKAASLQSFHVLPSEVVASRQFAEAVMQKDSMLGKYPDDFELVSLCDVSQEYEGQFEGVELVSSVASRVVITARQVLNAQPPQDQLPLKLEA